MIAGKNIIITGATSGIGEAIAARLSKEGGNVFIGGRRKDRGDQVAKDTKTTFHAVDVVDDASNKAFFEAASKHFGGLKTVDYILLNAGVEGNSAETQIPDISIENFKFTYAVNVGGVLLGLKYGAAVLKKGGCFVSTSSGLSVIPFGGNPIYASSKSAVDAVVRGYAEQLKESKDEHLNSLNVMSMNPTLYVSDMSSRFCGEDDNIMQAVALNVNVCQRIAKPSELAGSVYKLVKGDLPYKNGDVFVVDGSDNFPISEYLERLEKAKATNK